MTRYYAAILATKARGNSLRGDEYRCDRCGRIAMYNFSRSKPELCIDCQDVLRSIEEENDAPSGEADATL